MRQIFRQGFEAKFLVKIETKIRDVQAEFDRDFKTERCYFDELNPRVCCAFGNVLILAAALVLVPALVA